MDQRRALAAIDRILLMKPDSAKHVRDRRLLLAGLRETRGAIEELERYLELAPNAPDEEAIRELIGSYEEPGPIELSNDEKLSSDCHGPFL
jgi:regulator of sirC expression with transglutaminase-like and TPR domain